jgi:hypothetical protein
LKLYSALKEWLSTTERNLVLTVKAKDVSYVEREATDFDPELCITKPHLSLKSRSHYFTRKKGIIKSSQASTVT